MSWAYSANRSGSIPYWRFPIKASPDSLRSILLYFMLCFEGCANINNILISLCSFYLQLNNLHVKLFLLIKYKKSCLTYVNSGVLDI